jgi:membrane protein DedA with SNARE-associated domain
VGSFQAKRFLRRKAPQIILAGAIIAVVLYVGIQLLEDVVIEGTPLNSHPLFGAILSLTHDVTATMKSWSYGGVFVMMFLESTSLPFPSEVILPFAGYMVSTGLLNFWATVAVATVAGVAGSLVDYYIGLKGVSLLAKYRILGRILFTQSQLEVAAHWFTRYGATVVIFSRLVPGFRTIVSFPAGAVKMPLCKFITYTTIGCTIWNALLIYVGVFLGANWRQVAGISHYIIIAAAIGLCILVIAYFIWKHKRKRASIQPYKTVV